MGEIQTFKLSYDREKSQMTDIDLENIEGNLYRLHMTDVFAENMSFGDVIEADLGNDGILYFKKTVEKTKYKVANWLLTRDFSESEEFKLFVNEIVENGCQSEHVFGGYLIINIPETCSIDVEEKFKRAFDDFQKRTTV